VSDIFLSYAREDLERVKRIVAACEAKGWSVFWDRTIPAGKTWREIIGKALDEASCVVVAWSRTSVNSRWVQEEADEGRERGILIPLLLDDVRPPMGFRGLQAANLVDQDPTTAALRQVLADIAALLGPSSATQPGAPPPLAEAPADASRDRTTVGRAGWVPVLVTAAGWTVGGALGLALTFSTVKLFGGAFGGGVGWAIAGVLGGFGTAKSLRLVEPLVRSEHVVMLTVGWAVAAGLGGLLSWELLTVTGGILAGALSGAIGGSITGLALRATRPSFQGMGVGVLALGWAIGGSLGAALSWAFVGYHYTVAFYGIVGAATGAVFGLIGGLLTFSYLTLTSKARSG